MPSDTNPATPTLVGRRAALRCMAWAGGGILWTLRGGVPVGIDLAATAFSDAARAATGSLSFVQISDSHIGFNKDANPDATGTFKAAIALANAAAGDAAFVLHTGDVTHLSKPEQFDTAAELMKALKPTELHAIPGEHDVLDEGAKAFLERYGKASNGSGWYAFDHAGVHFVALVNVIGFKPGGQGRLGPEQIAWLESDLKGRSASQPIVVFAHMPLWSVYAQWGWGTDDGDQAFALLKRFGSVTVLSGHIHQVVQKVEGNIRCYSALSTAYPQATPGDSVGPGPLKVPADKLPGMLGVRSLANGAGSGPLAVGEHRLVDA